MFLNYVKTAWVVFLRRKFFTFINLFGITFTLAILLVASALLDQFLGSAPPEVNQNRTLSILRVTATNDRSGISSAMSTYKFLDKHLKDLPGAEKTSIFNMQWQSIAHVGDRRIESFLKKTDANFFDIIQFDFLEGRPFTQDEYDNGNFVAVINEGTREKFFGDENAIGKTIRTNGISYKVVGVVENVSFLRWISFADIWIPHTTDSDYNKDDSLIGTYMGLILADKKSSFPLIREEFISRVENFDLTDSKFTKLIIKPETPFQMVARLAFSQGKSLEDESSKLIGVFVLLGVLFMVLPSINLVNLNISRIMERASEIGIRKAFGAPKRILIGQFIFENLLLTLLGGLLSIALAYLILGLISSAGLIPYAEFMLNFRILVYALLASIVFGFLSGVYPAWRMSKMHPVEALRGGKL